jgi:predicted metalloprotease
VWAHHASRQRGGAVTVTLTERDIEQALTAAAAIGDDRLQQQVQGRVIPDSFTHGTSVQRQRWFRAGFDSGDVNRCDTFKAQQL